MSDGKTPQCQGTDQGTDVTDHESSSTPEPAPEHDGKGTPQLTSEATSKATSDAAQGSDGEDISHRDATNDVETADVSQHEKWGTIRRAWRWKPKPARYDPKNPPKFTIWLNILFGFVRRINPFTSPHAQTLNPTFPPGLLLHRLQPLLQPTHPQPHRRDVRRDL